MNDPDVGTDIGEPDGEDSGGWGVAAVALLVGLAVLGAVATAHSVWYTLLR